MTHERYERVEKTSDSRGDQVLFTKADVVQALFFHAYQRFPTFAEGERTTMGIDLGSDGGNCPYATLRVTDSPGMGV